MTNPNERPRHPAHIPVPKDIQVRIDSLLNSMERRDRDLADADGQERSAALAGTGPVLEEMWEDIREELREHFSDFWKHRRRLGIERRARELSERLASPPDLPDWLRLTPDGVFTDKQREAVILRHGYGLSLAEAAKVAGIGKSPMRRRIAAAERKVEKFYGTGSGEDYGSEHGGKHLILEKALKMAYQMRAFDEIWGREPGDPDPWFWEWREWEGGTTPGAFDG